MAGTTIKGVGNDGNVQIRDMVTAAKQNAGICLEMQVYYSNMKKLNQQRIHIQRFQEVEEFTQYKIKIRHIFQWNGADMDL